MSKPRIPYFDFYPSDFMKGIRGLTPQEVGVYTMLLCLIYEENGPVEYHVTRLSTYCAMRETSFIKTVERLIDLGKMTLSGGMLSNRRAMEEIESRNERMKSNSRAGKISAEKRQEKQRRASTRVEHQSNHTDSEPELNKEKEEPKGSSKKPAARASQVPSDFQPTSSGMEYAVAKGMPAAIIPAQVEKFILHHQSKGSTFKDVGRAWQTWCLNYASFRPTASNVVDHPRKAATDVTKYHPLAIDMGGGWWTQPGGEVEWYRDTNECRADKRTRDLQAAEEAEALRGAI